jgi:uncharacterized protein YbbC (DUF1343 family)
MLLVIVSFLMITLSAWAHTTILPGLAYEKEWVPLLKGKQVAVVINQTSEYNGRSLVDIFREKGIDVRRIFVPEHGFRGGEDAGAHIANGVDSATGLQVISLYGNNKKPTVPQLQDVDVVVYDLQDVGVRFYTYISTLQYCMEACATGNKQFVVLDRPNPNGFYVDGPVLDTACRSFVGMQPIPVVYGMTAGEYAKMLVGERWFPGAALLALTVVRCSGYTHSNLYRLPVAPSPNLRTMEAVYAYPSLCFFEGTPVSVGRGTSMPFRQYGCPQFAGKFSYSFTPVSGYGAKTPPHQDKKCYGELVAGQEKQLLKELDGRVQLKWLIKAWKNYPTKSNFFTSFFTKLSGTPQLEQQIRQGVSEKQIRKSWQASLNSFKQIRKKYLLYPDFD